MDKLKYLINMNKAFLLYPFKKKEFENRRIWLVGGNAGELYVDNARAIYEYVRSKKEIEEFWILNENSKIKDSIPGKTLVKGSVEAYLYFMNAEVAMFSHSISADIVPYLFVVPGLRKFHDKVLKVFLNHGTVGFKVNKAMNPKTENVAKELVKSYDINICDSEFEKNVKTTKWWNVPKNTAYITGYPRYDKLYTVNLDRREKEIFFMPTWRNWIRPESTDIEKTEYFKNIIGLITNETLNSFLQIKDIKLNVFIHQLMHDYLDKFENIKLGPNVKLLSKETDITKEMIKSEMLITDYSSVAYDFLYMDKPIIFFQFDKNEYKSKVGSYVDLDKELFGEYAKDIKQCVQSIVSIVNNNFKYSEEKKEEIDVLKRKFIKYTDKENCKRVFELIETKLGEKNGK